MEKLVKIKCPFKVVDRNTKELISCNRLCVKVYAGSSGEVWCRSCDLKFDFEVSEQNQPKIFIKTQSII
jgi:hypothetical protein